MSSSRSFVVVAGMVGAVGGLFAVPGATSAAVVAQYTIVDQVDADLGSPTRELTSTDAATNSIATSLTAGAGVTLKTSSQTSFGTGGRALFFETSEISGSATGASGATGLNDYLTFTVTPASGYEMDFTNLTLGVGTRRGTATGDYSTFAFVRTSADGFTSDVGATVSHTITNTGGQGAASSGTSGLLVDLSTLTNTSGPLTFRIYYYHTGPSAERGYTDNFVLNADEIVAVPEPTALGLAALSTLMLRRRR